jgi:hypothetical protein
LKKNDFDTFIFPPVSRAKNTRESSSGPDLHEAAEEEPQAGDDQPDEDFAEQEELPDSSTSLAIPGTPQVRPREDTGEDLQSPVSRRRLTRANFGSPKREAKETELLEVEESRTKHLRIASLSSNHQVDTSYVCNVGLKNGHGIPCLSTLMRKRKDLN